ncbi:hypothetical protein VE02_04616 [Pseudogymnoascus sp. 03VT05]|nr:hypothetical protein VE02_04616 [Pseudogymnoascus sp. 03VT05]
MGSTQSIQLTNIRKQDEEAQAPTKSPATLQARRERRLKLFSTLFAVFVACAIIGGATCALGLGIQHGITNARGPVNPGDRARWMKVARTKVYDACYNGCDASPNCAYEACAKTAALNITGVVCDANALWDERDRYPVPCLEAVAEIYKRDAFQEEGQDYLVLLVMLVPIVPFGLMVGLIVYYIFYGCVAGHGERKLAKARQRSAAWPRGNRYDQALSASSKKWWSRTASPSTPLKMKPTLPPKISKETAWRSPSWDQLSHTTLVNGAATCCYPYSIVKQYFVNVSRTVFGVVRGRTSKAVIPVGDSGKKERSETQDFGP